MLPSDTGNSCHPSCEPELPQRDSQVTSGSLVQALGPPGMPGAGRAYLVGIYTIIHSPF